MPKAIKYLISKGQVVDDYHKPEKPRIPRPAGPVLIIGVTISLLLLYLFTLNLEIIAILFTTIIAFFVGYIDDKKVMPGWFKPVALIAAAMPIILLHAYDTNLNLIFGHAFIPLLYIPLILIAIPIVGNTINSIDVLNGVASGYLLIACIPLIISIYIFGNMEILVAALSLFFVTLALYKYHKFPSKIFPGDSGALTLGGIYGAIAIVGQVEVIAAIALGPAILNSFLFLSSMKRIVEHREIKEKPVELTDDFKLKATSNKKASITLVRLILAGGKPLSEKEIGIVIFKLTIFSGILAIITAFLMGVSI